MIRMTAVAATLCLASAFLGPGPALAGPGPSKILLNLDGVPLIKAVKRFSKMTGRNFIVPEALRQRKITIVSATRVTPEEAYEGFLAALEAEGLKVEEDGKFHKIFKRERWSRESRSRRRPSNCGITDDAVRQVDDTTWAFSQAAVNSVFEDMSCLAMQARIVPSFENGEANGFKLFAIRPGSIYSLMGLRNGDIVHKINGYDLTSPDKALEVYQKLRDAKEMKLDISRRGKNRTLNYKIE